MTKKTDWLKAAKEFPPEFDEMTVYAGYIGIPVEKRVIGMTGTRDGMTKGQKSRFAQILEKYGDSLHHGDCVGADADSHKIGDKVFGNENITIHPPEKKDLRAYCDSPNILKEKSYFSRNRDIVHACDFLLGVPKSLNNKKGGTWYTINYAIGKKDVAIITPKGKIIWHLLEGSTIDPEYFLMSDILKAVEKTLRGLRRAAVMYDYNFSLKKNSLNLKRTFYPKNFFLEQRGSTMQFFFNPFGSIRGSEMFRKNLMMFKKDFKREHFRSPCKWRWKDSKGIGMYRYKYYENEREISWIRNDYI